MVSVASARQLCYPIATQKVTFCSTQRYKPNKRAVSFPAIYEMDSVTIIFAVSTVIARLKFSWRNITKVFIRFVEVNWSGEVRT